MPGLNLSQHPFDLRSIFQFARGDALFQLAQCLFHTRRDAVPHRGFFRLARRGPAQNVGLVSGRRGQSLHLDIGPDFFPLSVQQLLFKLLQLCARRAHQILSVSFPQCPETVLADDAPVEDPHSTRFAVLAFDHPDHRLQRRHIGPVSIKGLVAERKPVFIDDQCNDHLFAVSPVIARITAPHHRILFRFSFHVATGQVVEQHVECGGEQLPVTLPEMAFQFGLMRNEMVQTTIEPRVINFSFRDS